MRVAAKKTYERCHEINEIERDPFFNWNCYWNRAFFLLNFCFFLFLFGPHYHISSLWNDLACRNGDLHSRDLLEVQVGGRCVIAFAFFAFCLVYITLAQARKEASAARERLNVLEQRRWEAKRWRKCAIGFLFSF